MQYYARIDDVKDDSDAEIQRYKDDSRAKWETLSDQAKAEVGKALPATRLYIESKNFEIPCENDVLAFR